MLFCLTPGRDGSYIIALAMVFLAKILAPTFLLAAAPEGAGKSRVFICGSLQNKWLVLEAEQTPEGDEQPSFAACPLCSLFQLSQAAPSSTSPECRAPETLAYRSVLVSFKLYSSFPPLRHSAPRSPPVSV